MRAVGVARLAGRVQADRVVPVPRVGNDHERRAGGLVVAGAGVVDRPGVAAARHRPDVEPAAQLGVDGGAQRMADEGVLEADVAVAPGALVAGAEAPFETGHGGLEGIAQQGVAARNGVGAEPAVGRDQPVDQPLGVHAADRVPGTRGHDGAMHGALQLALPAHVDCRRRRLLVEHAVPGQELAARAFGGTVQAVQAAQQGDQVARRDRQLVELQRHVVDDGHVARVGQHLLDARRAHLVAPGIVQRLPVRIAVGHVEQRVVVRRGEVALGRVDDARQRPDRQQPVPFVAPVARHRHQAAVVRPDRRDAHRLVADVAGAVGPDHVLRRDPAVAARLDELLPRRGLIHPQARQVGRRAVVEPRRRHGVRRPAGRVLVDHRAVARVLQLDLDVGLPPHRDRLPDHGHRLPAAEIAVAVRVGRVGLVDVEVLVVLAEHGQPPRAVLVVADRHAGQHRLAAADDVPARRHQVHPVAQRRRRLHAVRVVRHDRIAAQRAAAVHDPVVAADRVPLVAHEIGLGRQRGRQPLERVTVAAVGGGDVAGLEDELPPMGVVPIENGRRETRRVDGRIEPQVGVADVVVELRHGVRAERGHGARVVDLLRHVRHQSLVARDHDLRRPVTGLDAQQLELEGQQAGLAGRPVDVGVDAVDERADDRAAALVVVAQLGRHVAPEAEEPRADVPLELARTEDLGHRAGRAAPPDLELEQAVAGRRVTLREEQVELVLRRRCGRCPSGR